LKPLDDISVETLAQWRAEGRVFVLLDVRELVELSLATFPGAVHIAMPDIPARLNELDRNAEIVVLCHHGTRSETVAAFMAANGFSSVRNVDGGIDAYSRRIDPTLRRY
jgi:rhodanese-related sulfurtransferase